MGKKNESARRSMSDGEAVAAILNACGRGKKYANVGKLVTAINATSDKTLNPTTATDTVRKLRRQGQLASDNPIRHKSTRM